MTKKKTKTLEEASREVVLRTVMPVEPVQEPATAQVVENYELRVTAAAGPTVAVISPDGKREDHVWRNAVDLVRFAGWTWPDVTGDAAKTAAKTHARLNSWANGNHPPEKHYLTGRDPRGRGVAPPRKRAPSATENIEVLLRGNH